MGGSMIHTHLTNRTFFWFYILICTLCLGVQTKKQTDRIGYLGCLEHPFKISDFLVNLFFEILTEILKRLNNHPIDMVFCLKPGI